MPIYILKRYHQVVPTVGKVWSLGRELAFEAPGDVEAISMAEDQCKTDHAPYGGLTIVFGPDGQRVWESIV